MLLLNVHNFLAFLFIWYHSSLTIDTSEARFLLIPSEPGVGKADFLFTGPVPELLYFIERETFSQGLSLRASRF